MISKSVGIGGSNLKSDVAKISRLLNRNRHLLLLRDDLAEVGDFEEALGDRIKLFQRRVVTQLAAPDGRVDPDGGTLAKLQENARDTPAEEIEPPLFPLFTKPTASYATGGRAFRARRSRTRLHAACDLIAPEGTPIRAMAGGKVIRTAYSFYSGTDALEVDHGGFVVRYGEIRPGSVPAALNRTGAVVSAGEIIAAVGRLNSGSSMLHLEIYSGTGSGPLTVRGNPPFQRRGDLLDPTDFLDIAVMQPSERTGSEAPKDDADGLVEAGAVRVTENVSTRLRVREEPRVRAPVLYHIGRGTVVISRGVETGDEYDFNGTPRDDWAEIEYLTQLGYVAAAFLAPAELTVAGGGAAIDAGTSDAEVLNSILFEYESSGASDRTARQDGLPQQGIHGVAASEAMAKTDLQRVEALKGRFTSAGLEEQLPPALLAAIASRESRCGAVLDNGFGDGGHGFGIMQIDDRSWSAEMSDGPDGMAHILQAAGILGIKLDSTETIRGLDTVLSLVTATSRYNGGRGLPAPRSDRGTTGGDYANDTWARARYYAEKIGWS